MAPTNEATISVTEPTAIPRLKNPIIVTESTSFAPDEIPRMNGPAIGFAKKVCSRKPDSASAPPRRIAGRMRTMRTSITITRCGLCAFVSPSKTSRIESDVLPATMFKNTSPISATESRTKPSASRPCR